MRGMKPDLYTRIPNGRSQRPQKTWATSIPLLCRRRKTIARPHQAAGTSARGIGSRTPAPSPVRRSAATAPRWRRAPSPSSTPSRIVREACPVASARKPIPQASRSRRRLSTDGCTECAPSSECGLSACCCDLAGVGGGTKRRLARKDARNERKDVRCAHCGACHRAAQTRGWCGRRARVGLDGSADPRVLRDDRCGARSAPARILAPRVRADEGAPAAVPPASSRSRAGRRRGSGRVRRVAGRRRVRGEARRRDAAPRRAGTAARGRPLRRGRG